jgi:competence protein ComEA
VPESLRESRIDPGKRGALLLTVVAAVAALVAAVGVWWDRPEPRPVQAVSLSQVTDSAPTTVLESSAAKPMQGRITRESLAALAPTRSADPATTSAGPAVLVVSVTGAVHRPGLVRLVAGSRVADAITKAGGATDRADLTGLNLAQKLFDGASVVVADAAGPTTGSGSSVSGSGIDSGSGAPDSGSGASGSASKTGAGGSAAPIAKVNLNTADVAALDALPGVGPVTAASIVSWREKNGHFTSVEQLQEIQGIGPAKYASLSPLVTL